MIQTSLLGVWIYSTSLSCYSMLSYPITHNLHITYDCCTSLYFPSATPSRAPSPRFSQSIQSIFCFWIIIFSCKIVYRSVCRINVVRYSFSCYDPSVYASQLSRTLWSKEPGRSCLRDGIRLNCLQERSSFLVELKDSSSFLDPILARSEGSS